MSERLNIAVVGGGIAGVTAAYLLDRKHRVTLFEANNYLGGHTNTILIPSGPDQGLAVDTGFIVCNATNYPNFYRLLKDWDVPLRNSEMSFGYHCAKHRFHYIGPGIREFLRAPLNIFNRKLIGMLIEQQHFNSSALRDYRRGNLANSELGTYIQQLKCSQFFVDHYLTPLIASIWSSPVEDVLRFPASTFITFFNNHGMLELSKRPQWQTVVGGSHSYLKAFRSKFGGSIRCESPVVNISRGEKVTLTLRDNSKHTFDRVVLAAHADQSLAMLGDCSPEERSLLGAWRYHSSNAVLHTDRSVLPPQRRHWASWNYYRPPDADHSCSVPITYYMNRLQGLSSSEDYFVTLNRTTQIDPAKIIYQTEYSHPAFSPQSVASQPKIAALNGVRNTYYCGSYLRYGFHEDAVISAMAVAKLLECEL